MAPSTIAEINTPRQAGLDAVGVIAKPGKKTSDATNSNSYSKRYGEQVARSPLYIEPSLDPFDRDQPADQSADNGFAGHQIIKIVPVTNGERRVGHPIEQLAAYGRACNCGSDYSQGATTGQMVSVAGAHTSVQLIAQKVSEALKHPMRVQAQRPQTTIK